MHYYQFNIGDYASHTRHLEPIEDLIYRRLLDLYYLHERPLNDDATTVAKQIGLRDEAATVRGILNEFFDRTPEGYRSARADREIAHYHSKIEQASRAGKASAQRRINARSTDVQPTNNQEPITNKQETKKDKSAPAQPPTSKEFDDFWKSYPKKVGKGAAEQSFKKIKPSEDLMKTIMQALERQKESDQWKDQGGRYIPNPATWLNQRRWEDEETEAEERSSMFAGLI